MKQKLLALCTAAFLFAACNNEKKEDKPTGDAEVKEVKEKEWIPIDSAMMDKAWQESMAVGEPHKMLAKSNGTWDGEVTMWFAPGAPPMTSKSTTVNSMVMGGRYQQSKHTGDMMGAPFEGMSTTAYDNAAKEYVSTWIDNMGTGIMIMKGQWDDATKSMNMSGKMMNPANGLECNMREVFKFVDDDHQVLEMYGPDPATGKEYKNMEIKYTRKK